MLTFELPRRELKGMSLFAAKKDIRYYLNAVCLEIHRCEVWIIVTDGHALAVERIMLDTELDVSEPVQVIIKTDDIKAIQKQTQRYEMPVKITVENLQSDGKRYIQINDCGTIRSFPAVDAKYPDFRRVVPHQVSGEVAQFNPELLLKFKDYADLFSATKGRISVGHNGQSGALVFIGRDDFVGVVMPMREDMRTTAPAWLHPPVPDNFTEPKTSEEAVAA